MPIDYTTLVGGKTVAGSIANWVSRDDLPVADILTEAQAWIYSRLRAREMIKRDVISITLGDESIAAPADFITALAVRLNADGRPLDKMTASGLEERRYVDETGALSSGKPRVFADVPSVTGDGGTYHFDTKADQVYAGFQWYMHRPAALGPANTTNFLTVRYPALLRRACLATAYEHRQDWARSESYEAKAVHLIAEANREADLDLMGAIFDSEVR